MAKYKIADARTGLRPLSEKSILEGIFNGDLRALELENGCVIYDDERPNYHTRDGREFAEVIEVQAGEIVGYTEITNDSK